MWPLASSQSQTPISPAFNADWISYSGKPAWSIGGFEERCVFFNSISLGNGNAIVAGLFHCLDTGDALGILNGFSFRENESTRRAFHLLSLEHQELVGAGFCARDFALATRRASAQSHRDPVVQRAQISPSGGRSARPRSRPSR
jgi:hypothetical protein